MHAEAAMFLLSGGLAQVPAWMKGMNGKQSDNMHIVETEAPSVFNLNLQFRVQLSLIFHMTFVKLFTSLSKLFVSVVVCKVVLGK